MINRILSIIRDNGLAIQFEMIHRNWMWQLVDGDGFLETQSEVNEHRCGTQRLHTINVHFECLWRTFLEMKEKNYERRQNLIMIIWVWIVHMCLFYPLLCRMKWQWLFVFHEFYWTKSDSETGLLQQMKYAELFNVWRFCLHSRGLLHWKALLKILLF